MEPKPNCTNPLCFSDDAVIWALNESLAAIYLPAMIFIGVLMILGLFGNGLVIYVYQFKLKVTTANIFIKWLAVLDVLCCMTGMPYEIYNMRFNYVYWHIVPCKLFSFLEMFSHVSSCLMLICVAIDRYYHICKPMKIFTKRKAYRLVAFMLILALFIMWPAGVVFGNQAFDVLNDGNFVYTCSISSLLDGTIVPNLFYLWLFIINISSLLCLVTVYILIGFSIAKWNSRQKLAKLGKLRLNPSTSRKEDQQPASEHLGKTSQPIATIHISDQPLSDTDQRNDNGEIRHKSRKLDIGCKILPSSSRSKEQDKQTAANRQRASNRLTIILCMVSAVYVISYIPYLVTKTIATFGIVDPDHLSFRVRQLWEVMVNTYFLSNAINPLIYGAFVPNFRSEVRRLLR